MSWPALVMYAVVLVVGVPAMARNPTAFGLVISWSIAQGLWYMTGDNLPLDFYFIADLTVIAIIYAKTISRCAGKVYDSGWHQLRCMVTDPTRCDRAIIALFVLGAWPLYGLDIGAWEKWWGLWILTVCQFLLAGFESLSSWRKAKRADPVAEPDTPSSGGFLRLARAGEYG